MIITLKGADFSKSNIGVFRLWSVTKTLAGVTTDSTVTEVETGSSYTATFTISDGCEFASATVTMGGTDITDQLVWSSDTEATLTISDVTGDIRITIETTADPSYYIVDPWACWDNGTESALSGYYSFVDYPVKSSTKYLIPYGRNYFFEDGTHTYISGGAGGGSATLTITTPDNASYITICFKYSDISTAEAAITEVTE